LVKNIDSTLCFVVELQSLGDLFVICFSVYYTV
jgi:hypothetical protein